MFGAYGILKHETKPELVFDSERRFATEAEGVEWINGEEGDLYAEGFHDEFDKEEYEGYWLDDIDVREVRSCCDHEYESGCACCISECNTCNPKE